MSFVPHLEHGTKGKNPATSLKGSSSGAGADSAAEYELDATARGQIDGSRVPAPRNRVRRGREIGNGWGWQEEEDAQQVARLGSTEPYKCASLLGATRSIHCKFALPNDEKD